MSYFYLLPICSANQPTAHPTNTLPFESHSCGMPCFSVRPEFWGTPVDLLFTRRPKCGILAAPLAQAIQRDLFEILGPHLRGAVIGRCFVNSRGQPQPIDGLVTCYTPTPHTITFRGGVGARYRRCRHCGIVTILSFDDLSYLDEREIDGRLAIQADGRKDFIIHESLRSAIEGLGYAFDIVPVPTHPGLVAGDPYPNTPPRGR